MNTNANQPANKGAVPNSSQQFNYFTNDSQSPSNENFSMFEQFASQSQSNPAQKGYQPPLYPPQNPLIQQQQQQPQQPSGQKQQPQQQERKKLKKLSVKSQTFQNIFAPSNTQTPQNNPEPVFTYDSATDVTLSSVDTEPISTISSLQINALNTYPIEHLELSNFKLKPCPHNTQHNHKQCPFYHNLKDRKRPGNFYSSDLCEYAENPENCPDGEMCLKAHNRVEQLYKPEKYKTKFCSHYPHSLQLCEYGTFCSFAHNEHDITIDLIHNFEYDDDFYMFHFKTVWCPFNLTQHDKALCVYAHNWQDYRRKPQSFQYDPLPCSNWKSTDFIVNYEDGCPLKEKCSKCHGWKELEYHPLNYKTKHCPSKNCTKGRDCPHYHQMKERRAITTSIANGVFKLMPRNRIVTGTFKKRKDESAGGTRYHRTLSMSEDPGNTSLDAGISFPVSMESLNELPPQEQLKWMNNMIQTMMARHSIESKKEEPEMISKGAYHRRTTSDESPYLPKKKSERETTLNPHILNLFGAPSEYGQQQEAPGQSEIELPMQNLMFKTILESPMKKFASRSVQNLDDPRQQYHENPMRININPNDSDLSYQLDKMRDDNQF